MSADSLNAASDRLDRALQRLDRAIDGQIERETFVRDAEEEVQRMTADRSRLAGELDGALARADRLERANREVSRRLVNAMEQIRGVIERRREG
jgi:ABC-type transporter Mla subunit MlaD